MDINLDKIRNVVNQLKEITDELKITISISTYGDSPRIRPAVFLHDNTDADTDYYDDMVVSHCIDSDEEIV